MKILTPFLTSLILSGWICASAIVAVQNFTPVSFRIFTFQTIEVPFGVVLALSAGLGAIVAGLAPFLIGSFANQEDDF